MSNGHSLPLTNGEPPILHKGFTSFIADINLTTQSARPPHAAQRLIVTNTEATDEELVLLDLAGNSVSYIIPAETAAYPIDLAITGIVASGTGTIAQVVAHWWQGPGYRLNP
jgi:hypothetical protein